MLYRSLPLIVLCSLLSISMQVDIAFSQNASLQGLVSDQRSAQPLFGANIYLEFLEGEKTRGVSTDENGFYSLGSIEPGPWLVRISYIGYQTVTDTLQFNRAERKTFNLSMIPADEIMGEVVVEQQTGAARREEGRQRITPVDISRVPTPGAADLVTYLQTLPGVVSMGDRGGQFFIRGGTPSQNMALVDGAMIYKPAHIVGFYSPFPESIVASADFYAGGFSPRYTGRIASVLDIRMRDGSRYETSASGAVGPFAAEVKAEGPIYNGQSSWIFSVRNSLIENTSQWYPVEEQPLKFQSQFIKGSFIDQNTRCSAMLMHTYDRGRIDFDQPQGIKWRNLILGGKCIALPEGSRALMDTNMSFTRFSNSVIDADPFGFRSSVNAFNIDFNLRQYAGDVRFDYGIITRLNFLQFDLDEKFAGIQDESYTEMLIGAYIESAIPVGDRLNLLPGTAFMVNPGGYGISLEPRFRFSWLPFGNEEQELSGSAGLYKQSVVGISDIRDLSSVFVAWTGNPIGDEQVKSLHYLLGWQQTLTKGFTWSVEGYYKYVTNMAVPVWNTIARFTTDLALADGDVIGADLRLEYNSRRFYGLIGYGYSRTTYSSAQASFSTWFGEPVQEYSPPHDRRHQVNALFSLDIGKFTAGLRWQLGTGVPYTRPIGFDDLLDFRERLPEVRNDRGTRRVILDRPFNDRLPVVHRLDVSLDRRIRISESGSSVKFQLGAINSYNQTNIFYYDVFTQRRIDQLPIIPYLTLELEVL
jgi:hypothetical protein